MSTEFMHLGFDSYTIDNRNFYNLKVNGVVQGFNLDVRLNYYRGLPLSCVENLTLRVDDQEIPSALIQFCINGKKFSVDALSELFAENWGMKTTAHLHIFNGGLSDAEHKVELKLELRCPYMKFAPRTYGKIDSSVTKTMRLRQEPSALPKMMPVPSVMNVVPVSIDALHGIDFAVSLYGFTERFFCDDSYCLEQVFQDLNRLGVKKFELIGPQVFENYPFVSDKEIDAFLALAAKYDVSPFSYGAYVDMGKYSDRDMTDSEILEALRVEMETANRLGCGFVRGPSVPAHLWPRLNEYAEIYGVKLGYEVHAPERPTDPHIVELAEMFDKLGCANVGFIPDFGCYIERPNQLSVDRFLNMGAKKELLNFIIENRWNGYTFESMSEKIQSMGGGMPEKLAVGDWFGFMSFAPADVEGFREILLPHALYFHGKFYHIGEDCVETTIPYEALLQAIVKSGFQGTIMTEYEGHTLYQNDAVEQISRHLTMEKRILGSL